MPQKTKSRNIPDAKASQASFMPLDTLTEMAPELDALASLIKRLALWSAAWGQGMALLFFLKEHIYNLTASHILIISVETIIVTAAIVGIIAIFLLFPFLYSYIIIGKALPEKIIGRAIYFFLAFGYGILIGYALFFINSTIAISVSLLILIFNISLPLIKKRPSIRSVVYTIFLIPPVLFMCFLLSKPLQYRVMSYIGEINRPEGLLINKSYKPIQELRFDCKMYTAYSPLHSFYAFSRTDVVRDGSKTMLIRIYGDKHCHNTFDVPDDDVLFYKPVKPIKNNIQKKNN